MRKILALLLTVMLLFCSLPLGAFTVNAEGSGTTGDCTWTLDGTVLKNILYSDLDQNGKINIIDLIRLKKQIA